MQLLIDEATISGEVAEVHGTCSALIVTLPSEDVKKGAGFKTTRYQFDLDRVDVKVVVTTKSTEDK
jgi:hypothetical protein